MARRALLAAAGCLCLLGPALGPEAALAQSTASGAGRATYPRAFVQRPYTLPVGYEDFWISTAFLLQKAKDKVEPTPGYEVDLLYRRPIEEDFNLLLGLVSVGFQYRQEPLPDTERGVSWSLGFVHRGRWGLKPSFDSMYRRTLGKDWAVEGSLSYFVFIPFVNDPTAFSVDAGIGPVWQASDDLALKPNVHVSFDNVIIRDVLEERRKETADDPTLPGSQATVTFPIGLIAMWSMNEKWDLNGEYAFLGLGLNSDIYTNYFGVSLRHTW